MTEESDFTLFRTYILVHICARFDIYEQQFFLSSHRTLASLSLAFILLLLLLVSVRTLSRLHNSAPTKQLDKRSRKNRVRSRKTYSPRSHMWKLLADTATVNKKRKKKKC